MSSSGKFEEDAPHVDIGINESIPSTTDKLRSQGQRMAGSAQSIFNEKLAPKLSKTHRSTKGFIDNKLTPQVQKSSKAAHEFLSEQVAPKLESASAQTKDYVRNVALPKISESNQRLQERYPVLRKVENRNFRVLLLVPAAAIVGLFFLLFPIGQLKVASDDLAILETDIPDLPFLWNKIGFFNPVTAWAGSFIMFLLIVMLVVGILCIIKPGRSILKISGIVAVVAGLLLAILGFSLWGTVDLLWRAVDFLTSNAPAVGFSIVPGFGVIGISLLGIASVIIGIVNLSHANRSFRLGNSPADPR